MTRYAFDWVDAFTDRPFGGNGCAVVHDGAALDDETCMAFVRETSLVECTFTGPSDIADIRVRYFLASREIPFAGHPTLATVRAMIARGLVPGNHLTLDTGAGVIPVTIDGDRIEMTQRAPAFGTSPDPALVAAALSLDPADIAEPPQLVSTGLGFVITVLRDHDALRRARLDIGALADLGRSMGNLATDLAEPFLVTLQGATDRGDTFSRLLLAPPSPAEDPFTGSATGAMAAFLWARRLMTEPRFIAEQGHWLGRPGEAEVSLVGTPDAITGVRVAGRGHVLMSGTLALG